MSYRAAAVRQRGEPAELSEVTTAAVPVLGLTQRIEGGWRVHSTGRFHVDILRMLGANLRLVTTPVDQPFTYTRAWCYQRPLVEVVLAAIALDPDGDDEPVGWIKQVGPNAAPAAGFAGPGCRSMPASTRSARIAATPHSRNPTRGSARVA